jgi:hypothetical protein
VDHEWAQRNERKKKEMAQEMHVPWAREKERKKEKHPGDKHLLGLSPHCVLFPPSPSPLVWQVTWGAQMQWCLCPPSFPCHLSPSHPLTICHLLVPLSFAIFSFLSLSSPPLLLPVPTLQAVAHSGGWGAVVVAIVVVFSSLLFVAHHPLLSTFASSLSFD